MEITAKDIYHAFKTNSLHPPLFWLTAPPACPTDKIEECHAYHCKKFLEQVIEAQAFPKDDARYTELMIALESGRTPIIKLPDQKWPKAFFRLQLMMPRSRCHLSHNAPQNKN